MADLLPRRDRTAHQTKLRYFWERVAPCIPSTESDGALEIGPFTVTPFLIDHSAFDAYIVPIEV
jgi:hypothetical protein